MFITHLKIARRNLWRNKTFVTINMAGLAIGIALFIFIIEYVTFEWSANRFHKNYTRLYRTMVVSQEDRSTYHLPPGFAPVIQQNFANSTGIRAYVRTAEDIGNGVVSVTDNANREKAFLEDKVMYVDGNFLDLFTFPLVAGTPSLNEPNTVAISETTARRYFDNDNAVGKIIKLSNQFGTTPYTVTAVFNDMPGESDIKSNILLSFKTLENPANRNGNDWADPRSIKAGFSIVYLLIADHSPVDQIADQITKFVHKVKPQSTDRMAFQPMSELHLAPSFNYIHQTFGSLKLVVALLSIAVLILLIAWVNYINLSTAQALNRAKEVGVRKVLGAQRHELVVQYLTETFLLTILSTLVAILLVLALQGVYNGFTGKSLSILVLNRGWFWLLGVVLIFISSILSGGYVALVLTGFSPIAMRRNKFNQSGRGLTLLKGLVVFQFMASIIFIIATIVLYRQLSYMQTQDLGINLEQRLIITGPSNQIDTSNTSAATFKNELSQLPFVKSVASSDNTPGMGYNLSNNRIYRLGADLSTMEEKTYYLLKIDDNYFGTYEIPLVAGKNFTPQMVQSGWENDGKVIVNEKAVKQLGFTSAENAISQKIKWQDKDLEIIGVVKDYHHLSLRQLIEPTIFLPSDIDNYFTLKLNAADISGKISSIKTLYESVFPGNPFDYFFLDQMYDNQYKEEQRLGRFFIVSALIAVFIACMGLYGLTTFTAKQRKKEIGIRKVLGANTNNIVQLLAKDFMKLVMIAIVISCPIAWWLMHRWLENFAYRISISWWMFVVAGVTALLIALITISMQAVKAAWIDPVKSIRTE